MVVRRTPTFLNLGSTNCIRSAVCHHLISGNPEGEPETFTYSLTFVETDFCYLVLYSCQPCKFNIGLTASLVAGFKITLISSLTLLSGTNEDLRQRNYILTYFHAVCNDASFKIFLFPQALINLFFIFFFYRFCL